MYQSQLGHFRMKEIGAVIMDNPTWKFIFFAAILFQIALSAPPMPGPPMDFESGWQEGPRSAASKHKNHIVKYCKIQHKHNTETWS